MLKDILETAKKIKSHFLSFLYWAFVGCGIGVVVGAIGTAFAHCLSFVTELRSEHLWIVTLLPLLGVIIVFLYNRLGLREQPGTDLVLLSVRTEEPVPIKMAPLIFVSSILTHLGGGSAGREGAALQIGASISQQIGRWLKADTQKLKIFSMCGMSACFSCLLGTPVAATIFSIEVANVGIMQYAALVPCATAALLANFIARYMHVHHMGFEVSELQQSFELLTAGKVCLLAIGIAIISILFLKVLHIVKKLYKTHLPNRYLRIIVGGTLVVLLTLILRTPDYLGAGESVIASAFNGQVRPEAFLLKILFTALTLSCGYKGGEIVPTLFVGSTFGCVFGGLIGLDPALGAALGMVSLFCAMTNCPITSIFLGLELLGGEGVEWLLLSVVISYLLSGYFSLYSQQKIAYSKRRVAFIDKSAR